MYSSSTRKARVYDRLEGQERLEAARRRFGEVDASAEALRPGAVVALSFDCDELLAARRSGKAGGQWSLATATTDWSSRGAAGWHTHAGDYAVETLEPECLFRVKRDGPLIALASVSADGLLLAASGSGDELALAVSGSAGWAAVGAAWQQRDGVICNSRWPEKVLAVRLLHITCLPTTQLQRVEEFFGGLLHELHSEKASGQKRLLELQDERDLAKGEALRWRTALEMEEQRQEEQRRQEAAAQHAPAPEPAAAPADVTAQLAALQRQLEQLAAEGLVPEVQQEQARMGIALRTIKARRRPWLASAASEITDLVRQSASATPRSNSSPTLGPPAASAEPSGCTTVAGESSPEEASPARLRDYLGSRPEQADPLERVLGPQPGSRSPDSPSRRVLQALSLAAENDPASDDGSSCNGGAAAGGGGKPGGAAAAPGSGRKRNPLLASVSAAVCQLAAGSPREADGMAQFMATSTSSLPLRASHPQPAQRRAAPLRASQQQRGEQQAARLRSSFLNRPPAPLEELYRC